MQRRHRSTHASLAALAVAAVALAGCGSSHGLIPAGARSEAEKAVDARRSRVVPAPTDGRRFVDPDGRYAIDIGPGWEEATQGLNGMVAWSVGPAGEGFGPNLNILTERGDPRPMSEYLDLSKIGLRRMLPQAEILDAYEVTGSAHQELGIVEYAAEIQGRHLRFLAIAVALDDGFGVLTFTAEEDSFDQARAEAEPYLRTFRPT
jgi:hypothetical protein